MEEGDNLEEKDYTKTSTLWIDWLVYTIFCLITLSPFFKLWDEYFKLIGAAVLLGAIFGILNRIIRELVFIKRKLDKNEKN